MMFWGAKHANTEIQTHKYSFKPGQMEKRKIEEKIESPAVNEKNLE